MQRTIKKLILLTLLSAIAGLLAGTVLAGRSLRATPAAQTVDRATTEDQTTVPPAVLLTEATPTASRVSVAVNPEATESYALLRGAPLDRASSRRTDLDFWFGQYSDRDYRPLPASPIEKEPSRLNVKLSIAF